MNDNVILAEQDLSFEDGRCQLPEGSGSGISIDHLYRIVWDGTEYSLTAAEVEDGLVILGNASIAGVGNDTEEPFCFLYYSTDGSTLVLTGETGSTTHTVAIYKPEGIVLKDRNGNDVAYYGIETVTFDTTTEGKQQVYTKGVAVDGLEIVPDFSGGDMAISAAAGMLVRSAIIKKPDTQISENIRKGVNVGGVDGSFIGDTEEITVDLNMADGDQVIVPTADGKVISKVTVKKPETLIPENIGKDIVVAGIVGALSGGAKVAFGVIEEAKTEKITINHGLGVNPDVIVYYYASPYLTSGVALAISFSPDFKAKYNIGATPVCTHKSTTMTLVAHAYDINNTVTGGSVGIIMNANTETFDIMANSSYPINANTRWFAIGGLT